MCNRIHKTKVLTFNEDNHKIMCCKCPSLKLVYNIISNKKFL